jgi:hypothetical protein
LLEDELPDGVAPKLRDLQETFRYASAQGNAGWARHLARLFAKFSRERPLRLDDRLGVPDLQTVEIDQTGEGA